MIANDPGEFFFVFLIFSMRIALIILFFLAGIAIGSFLNVIVDRLSAGKTIFSPRLFRYCPNCRREKAFRDLVPVLSYLWLRGRCRYCGNIIPIRSFIVELCTGLLSILAYWYYGLSWELGIVIVYCCLFIVLIVTDLEYGILPNIVIYSGMIIAIIFAGVTSIFCSEHFFLANQVLNFTELNIVYAAIGGSVGFVILFIIALIFRGGMGWGDVKFAGFIGLAVGFPLILLAIFLAVMSGGIMAVILLLLKRKSRKETIPFGPFLALAAMAALFWGNDLIYWYLKASAFAVVS